jgi:hypothetical protein
MEKFLGQKGETNSAIDWTYEPELKKHKKKPVKSRLSASPSSKEKVTIGQKRPRALLQQPPAAKRSPSTVPISSSTPTTENFEAPTQEQQKGMVIYQSLQDGHFNMYLESQNMVYLKQVAAFHRPWNALSRTLKEAFCQCAEEYSA